MKNNKFGAIILVAILILSSIFTFGVAANEGEINACVTTGRKYRDDDNINLDDEDEYEVDDAGNVIDGKKSRGGKIRIVADANDCRRNETHLVWNIIGPPGEQGPQGEKGEMGPAGPAGADGAQGPEGPQGPAGDDSVPGPEGPTGADGPQGPAGTDGTDGQDGADGAQGLPGEKGDAGDTGPAGANGADGQDGANGAQGPQGEKGDTGDTGPSGPAGPPGVVGTYIITENFIIDFISGETNFNNRAICNSGDVLTGGGYAVLGDASKYPYFNVVRSYPAGNSWYVSVQNTYTGPMVHAWNIYANCLDITP